MKHLRKEIHQARLARRTLVQLKNIITPLSDQRAMKQLVNHQRHQLGLSPLSQVSIESIDDTLGQIDRALMIAQSVLQPSNEGFFDVFKSEKPGTVVVYGNPKDKYYFCSVSGVTYDEYQEHADLELYVRYHEGILFTNHADWLKKTNDWLEACLKEVPKFTKIYKAYDSAQSEAVKLNKAILNGKLEPDAYVAKMKELAGKVVDYYKANRPNVPKKERPAKNAKVKIKSPTRNEVERYKKLQAAHEEAFGVGSTLDDIAIWGDYDEYLFEDADFSIGRVIDNVPGLSRHETNEFSLYPINEVIEGMSGMYADESILHRTDELLKAIKALK